MQSSGRRLERMVLHPTFSRFLATCEWAVIASGTLWLLFGLTSPNL
jgi:hypothetical protein